MGQLATKVNEINQRSANSLPGSTILNPREECKAITFKWTGGKYGSTSY